MYYFKPNGHWNIITEAVYVVLLPYYGPDMLRAA